MKKIFITISLCLFSILSYSQDLPWARYQRVENDTEVQSDPFISNQERKNSSLIQGYYFDRISSKLKRCSIRVAFRDDDISGLEIRVSYFTGGTFGSWTSFVNKALGVDKRVDGQQIANLFEWKVYTITYGNIYFNLQ